MANETTSTLGSWNDPGVWSGDAVPNAATNATVDGIVSINSAATAESVTANGVLELTGGSLNASHGLTDNGFVLGEGVIGPTTAVTGAGELYAIGGTLEVQGSIDATGSSSTRLGVETGGVLELDGTVGNLDATNDPTVTFGGAGVLDLTGEGNGAAGELAKFQGTVEDFVVGDKIEVVGALGDTVHYNLHTDMLTVESSAGAIQAEIPLAGSYAGSSAFSIQNVGGTDAITTNTVISGPSGGNATCFMAGTVIRTPEGETAVETLKRGDLVVTADGLAKPVSWLGRQTISTVFADPMRVWPIRIKAGALAENVPARDLVLSPDHAVLVEGALIHAGALVNGASIVRELRVPRFFVYYHVELDDHSLVLAENTPAETFIDNVDRLAFDNWAEHDELYPNGKIIEELPYPRAKARRQVPVNLRVKLAERAQSIGAAGAAAA
jgi:hypothetical protein